MTKTVRTKVISSPPLRRSPLKRSTSCSRKDGGFCVHPSPFRAAKNWICHTRSATTPLCWAPHLPLLSISWKDVRQESPHCDRAATIRALADPASRPETFGRPGHINPLYAQDKGVLRRAGHTEAAVDLARLSGLQPAAALIEILNPDGTMARMPELQKVAAKFGIKIVAIRDLIAYRLKKESMVERGPEVDMPTDYGHFKDITFRQTTNGLEHVALIKGTWEPDEPILVRVHSSCVTGDIFGSQRCDCGAQLHKSMRMIEEAGKGVILYMNQEGRGIGLFNKMKAYKLQEEGMDTVDANVHLGFLPDEREYGVGAQILHELGVHKMRLLTNNPVKRVGLEAYGLEIVENVPIEVPVTPYDEQYMRTKKERMGHTLHFNK